MVKITDILLLILMQRVYIEPISKKTGIQVLCKTKTQTWFTMDCIHTLYCVLPTPRTNRSNPTQLRQLLFENQFSSSIPQQN